MLALVVVVVVEVEVVALGAVLVVVVVLGGLGVVSVDEVLVVLLGEPPHAATASATTAIAIKARGLTETVFVNLIAPSCSVSPSQRHATICAMEARRRPPRPTLSPIIRWLDGLSPWWGPQLVVAVALGIDVVLPKRLTIGPAWLLPSVEGALLVALVFVSPHPSLRHSPLRRQVAIGLIGLVSGVNIYSLVELARDLLNHNVTNGRELIYSGIALWITNVLLFGLWYFELDRGGPVARLLDDERHPDFLFVQMAADAEKYAREGWTPRLVDYLYTSLTNATAFSPTDTMPLTANAKWLMSTQSLVSLVTLGLIIARAVNILQ